MPSASDSQPGGDSEPPTSEDLGSEGDASPEEMIEALEDLIDEGDYEEAAGLGDELCTLPEAKDDPYLMGQLCHLTGVARLHLGDPDRGLELLLRAAELFEHCDGALVDLGAVLVTIAEVSIEVGDVESGRQMCARALDLTADVEPVSDGHAASLNYLNARAFIGLGSACARAGELDPAADYLARAGELMEAAFGPGHPEQLELLERVAELWDSVGQPDRAAAARAEIAAQKRM